MGQRAELCTVQILLDVYFVQLGQLSLFVVPKFLSPVMLYCAKKVSRSLANSDPLSQIKNSGGGVVYKWL